MKIIIINTHSSLNSGDAGIVLAQYEFFKKHFSEIEITLTSRTPKIDQGFFKPLGFKVLPPISPTPSVYPNVYQKIEKSVKHLFALKDKRDLVDEIKKSDVVISSGGGYFFSHRRFFPGPVFFQNFLHVKIAASMNKRVIFFPQSFGPFYDPYATKILSRIFAQHSVFKIYTREEVSFNFVKDILDEEKSKKKIDLCPDIAFYLRGEDDQNLNEEMNLPKPIAAMTLRQWDFPDVKNKKDRAKKQEEYYASFKKVCLEIYSNWNGSIVLFPMARGPGNFENDRIISRKFWNELKDIIPETHRRFLDFSDSIHPFQIIRMLSQVDLIIATRFHSAIFSLISNIPVISIHYQPKSKGMMKMLGLEDFCVDINEVRLDKILSLIEEILNNYENIQKRIQDGVVLIRNNIEHKLEPVIELLKQ